MTGAATAIAWPEEHRPEVSIFHAVNELQIAAPPGAEPWVVELRTPLPVSAKRLQKFWDEHLR